MWLTRITIVYVGALAFVALLAVAGYFLPQTELKWQQSSAAVLNLTGRQYMLLERTAMLAELLILTEDEPTREECRRQLREAVQQMEAAHTALLRGDAAVSLPAAPPSVRAMYLEAPVYLDQQVRRYLAEMRKLVQRPAAELTAQSSDLQYIQTEASGALAEGLAELAAEQQRLDEASVRRLRGWQTGMLAGMLATLLALGVFVFRPLVRRVQREQDEKVRAERLAVIGTMAAKFTHEIRNPLGSIRLNLDSVRDALAMVDNVQPLLRSLDSEVRRIHRISDGYLQFARLPKGERRALSLNEWLAGQLRFCAAEFQQRRIRLCTQLAPGLPPVRADDGQLWQAVLNIVRNAWEAMPEGGTLTVRTARGRGHLVLEIADTGAGMTAEQQRWIFQPFFTGKPDGTGLGLALTQQIITEHGGHITCASQPGAGTTFTIRLPLTKENPHEKQSHHSAH
jgi:signal transduction histidine kinase